MEYKDTLTLYEELIAAGVPETSAKIQAHQLGGVTDCMGEFSNTLNEFSNILNEIQKDMSWMRIIGAAMTVAFFSNGFFMWLK